MIAKWIKAFVVVVVLVATTTPARAERQAPIKVVQAEFVAGDPDTPDATRHVRARLGSTDGPVLDRRAAVSRSPGCGWSHFVVDLVTRAVVLTANPIRMLG